MLTQTSRLSSTELELLPIKVLHRGNREFRNFIGFCDLDLDLMTFTYELNPYPVKTDSQTEKPLSTSTLSKVIVIQTYRQTCGRMPPKLLARRFAGDQNTVNKVSPKKI